MKWGNLLHPLKVAQALRIEVSALWALRYGAPDVILHFLGGLGDELLLTCVAHELRERTPDLAIWQISHAAELLRGNPDYARVFGQDHWALRHSNLLGRWRRPLRYSQMPAVDVAYEVPPREHILAVLCRAAGIYGRVRLRPWYYQPEAEARAGRYAPRQIAVQSVGARTHETWMQNKVWFHDRMQQVVERFIRAHPEYRILQIGAQGDPPLQSADDLRGKTTLRQTAAILSQSVCFLGTSGLLAHLARAVECRSVIVYGGREHAWQSGYSCNENLEALLPCAPCWLWHDCDFEHQCMRNIGVQDVLDALERTVARQGQPLATDELDLGSGELPPPRTYPTVPGTRLIADLPPFDS